MTMTLLPPNATRQERYAAQACADAMALPIPIRQLWDPYNCPAPLLPWLAASFSVDRWDNAWPEATKRSVIAASYFIHAHKGTIGAVRRVVEPMGYLMAITEWWQTTPEGDPGTFAVDIGVSDAGITEQTYQELVRLIADAKPMTRHLSGLHVKSEVRGNTYIGAAVQLSSIVEIYPYQQTELLVSDPLFYAATAHWVATMTVYPELLIADGSWIADGTEIANGLKQHSTMGDV